MFIVFALIGYAHAENEIEDAFLDAELNRVEIKTLTSPGKKEDTSSQSFSEKQSSLSGSVTVYKTSPAPDEKKPRNSLRIAFNPGFQMYSFSDFQAFGKEKTFKIIKASGSAFWLRDENNFGLISLGANSTSDNDNSTATSLTPYFVGLLSEKMSEKSVLLYGGAYASLLGRSSLLPIVGWIYSASENVSLTVIVPALFKLSYKASPSWTLATFLKFSGFRALVNNDQNLGSSVDKLEMQLREAHLGFDFNYKITDTLKLNFEVGGLVARQLKLLNGSESLLEKDINNSVYIQLGLSFKPELL